MVTFTARRSEPELVRPARRTPVETKALSDLDDQWSLRFYESIVGFFRSPPGETVKPGKVARGIKAAVAAALVYYYPMAGRLRKLPDGNKLVVDCTGEGVMFVEATADVRLEDLGQPLVPPYPCVEEFLGDAGDTRVVVGKPLLFLQVTQLKCGGFVIGLHMCHCIADGFGILQFIKSIADFACGELVPTTLPVWKRDTFTTPVPSDHILNFIAMVTFTARRSEPELVRPARPTPVETKALSDLDDQWSLRFYESIVGFFRSPPGETVKPGKVAKGIKAAVAGALVYYYPMAGRLRKLPDGNKLVVDCTGEGVMFVEATADVRLEDLGQPLVPPYPCVEEFLGDAGNTRDVIGKPLLFLQVAHLS
ncbi:hypothetical protein ZWY2020_036475 [Hordeum vulgare]|nr:hypothetical protein ZWY2020_036475 [Hordeum vulgare]